MALVGAKFSDQIGTVSPLWSLTTGGLTTWDMKALNAGWCARFRAKDTRDVYTVNLNWSAATGCQITVRIETITTGTGLPSGTLYDTNATVAQAPAAGWQAFTFATPPSTNLTAGNDYAIVALNTSAGTAATLRSHVAEAIQGQAYPWVALTAADGTTRSNFAEVSGGMPIATLTFSDGVEEPLEFVPWATQTSYNLFGNAATGTKFVIPANTTCYVRGVKSPVIKVGTPAGDLRARIFNSSDAVVSGTTCTLNKNTLSGLTSNRGLVFPFAAPVALTGGTYRVVFDSQSSANSSNCWKLSSGIGRSSSVVPSSHIITTTADSTAGPPITWTDTAGEESPVGLLLDSETASGGGLLLNPGMTGGFR